MSNLYSLAASGRRLPHAPLSGPVRIEVDPTAIARPAWNHVFRIAVSQTPRLPTVRPYYVNVGCALMPGIKRQPPAVRRPVRRPADTRSEERRVGKERRARWSP